MFTHGRKFKGLMWIIMILLTYDTCGPYCQSTLYSFTIVVQTLSTMERINLAHRIIHCQWHKYMRQGTQTGPYAGGVRGPGVRTNPPFRRHTLNYVRTKLREASPHARRILHGPVHDAQRGYADYRSVLGSMNCEGGPAPQGRPAPCPKISTISSSPDT